MKRTTHGDGYQRLIMRAFSLPNQSEPSAWVKVCPPSPIGNAEQYAFPRHTLYKCSNSVDQHEQEFTLTSRHVVPLFHQASTPVIVTHESLAPDISPRLRTGTDPHITATLRQGIARWRAFGVPSVRSLALVVEAIALPPRTIRLWHVRLIEALLPKTLRRAETAMKILAGVGVFVRHQSEARYVNGDSEARFSNCEHPKQIENERIAVIRLTAEPTIFRCMEDSHANTG